MRTTKKIQLVLGIIITLFLANTILSFAETISIDGKLKLIGNATMSDQWLIGENEKKQLAEKLYTLNAGDLKSAFNCSNVRTKTLRVAYEDLFPNSIDADYNDFVVDIHIQEFSKTSSSINKLRAINMIFTPKARGAAYDHKLKMDLSKVYTSTSLAGDIAFQWNKTKNGNYNIIDYKNNFNNSIPLTVFSSTKQALPSTNSIIFANTIKDEPTIDSELIGGIFIVIKNDSNTEYNKIEIGIPKYNPVLNVTNENGQNGQGIDFGVFNVDSEKYYDPSNNYPYGIVVDKDWKWPLERININEAYKKFMIDGKYDSNGDWYKYLNINKYDSSKVY